MDPASALADLTEISTQVESAVLASPDGTLVASTLTEDGRAADIAANAVRLLDGASDGEGSREPTQLRVATREGCVFVARDDRHVVAAVTGPDPTTGLVFYDLKNCLRMVSEESAKPKPKRKRAPKKTGAERA